VNERRWMKVTLIVAGLYNLAWGAWAILLPHSAFQLAGMALPNYPELWQCIGMIVGVYGVGYLAASTDAVAHWPIVLVGLLGKVFGPIGFLQAATQGRMPWKFGWTIVTNDLIWWIPFGLILYRAYRDHLEGRIAASPEVQRMAMRARTQHGESLLAMSQKSPVMVVFLRHFGCTFCREAVADIAERQREIDAAGTKIVFVHMGSDEQAQRFFASYGMEHVARISDPEQSLYRAFGLPRGGVMELFGPKVWVRGFQAGVLRGHGVGALAGDGFQMPGVFLLFHGEILRSYRHQSAADRPDYLDLTSLELVP
jgi:peroxiredoxin